MSDIFLSYSREDRARAERLASALESAGWSVWWDRKIPFGQGFDDVTAEALATARSVIVLWTEYSVKSDWVRAEASEGQARKVLIPLRLDTAAELPLAFKRLQTADLSDWEPDTPHVEYNLLLQRIRIVVEGASERKIQPGVPGQEGGGKPAKTPGDEPQPPAAVPPPTIREEPVRRPPSQKRARAWAITAFIVLPTVLAGAVALALESWRVATPVQANLLVDRVDFRVAGTADVPVLATAPSFRSLEVESFSRMTFTPATGDVEVVVGRSDGGIGWQREAAAGQMVLLGQAAPPSTVTFTAADATQGPVGRIADLKAAPGTLVVAERGGPGLLKLTLQRPDSGRNVSPAAGANLTPHEQGFNPNVSVSGRLQLEASRVSAMPRRDWWAGDAMRLRVDLHPADPLVQIESLPEELKLYLTLASDAPVALLPAIQVSGIRVAREGSGRALESALLAEGEMRYPGYEAKGTVRFQREERPIFEGLDRAEISGLRFDPRTGSIELAFTAEAAVVRSETTPGNSRDHRLSALDKLWYGSKTAIVFAICAWVVSFLFGVYKLYRP